MLLQLWSFVSLPIDCLMHCKVEGGSWVDTVDCSSHYITYKNRYKVWLSKLHEILMLAPSLDLCSISNWGC